MNPQTHQSRHQIRAKFEKLRGELWPEVNPSMLWHRKRSDGFSTIPRTLSLIMVMMDSLSKGRPVSSTYLELWCRTHDEALLILTGKEHEYATASGFSGERAINTWGSRLDILEQMGFIQLAEGPGGDRSYALLLNPYHVLVIHKSKIEKFLWNSFLVRAVEIRAKDMDPAKPNAEVDSVEHSAKKLTTFPFIVKPKPSKKR